MKKKKTLAILRPGKYLMLNRNCYLRVSEDTSVLLIKNFIDEKRIALFNNELLIVNKNEIKIQ